MSFTVPGKANKSRSPLWLKPFVQIPGLVNLTLRQLQYHLGLMLLALLGIVLAVALVTDASFFSQAVDQVILNQELADFSQTTGRPPFSTNVYVFPSSDSPVTLEDAEKVSHQIAQTLSSEVGLPLRHSGVQVSSGGMILQPGPESGSYTRGKDFLGTVEAVYLASVAKHMEIDAGAPLNEEGASGNVLEVWVHDRLVQEMGLQLGETLKIRPLPAVNSIPIRLAGFWRAQDPKEDFWFNDLDSLFKSAFLVRRKDYIKFIQPVLPSGAGEASWHIILDDTKAIPKYSASYLAGFQRGQAAINRYLPDARLNSPPLKPLGNIVQRSTTLTILLLGYKLPTFGILLYFLALTSAIIVQWQRKEISIMVSRGMSLSGILNLVLLEQLLLFVIGYPLGIAFGMLIARVMGYAASFLTFTQRAPLPVSFQGLSIPLTLLA
jgi:hypothetical protein